MKHWNSNQDIVLFSQLFQMYITSENTNKENLTIPKQSLS